VQIDWLTVGAQVVNFLVLVYLLKRFLYRPVLDAMARREARIAERMQEADQREAAAAAREQEFRAQSADLAHRRAALLDEAKADAEAERRRRTAEAQAEVEAQRGRWHEQVKREWLDLRKTVARQVGDTVTDVARRALRDLAGTGLERAIAGTFARRLAELDTKALAQLQAHDGPVDVASALDLDEDVRREITDTVRAQLGRPVRFVTDETLIGGIELRTPDWRMSWTIADYLRDLDEELGRTLHVDGADG